MKFIFSLCLVFSLWICCVKSYRILGVFPLGFKSHYNVGNAVMKSLVDAGHNVTMISPFPRAENTFNYQDISIAEILLDMQNEHAAIDPFELGKLSRAFTFPFMYKMGLKTTNQTLSHPKVQQLMSSNEKFDAIIVQVFNIDALFGLGEHFGCPVVGVTTFGAVKWVDEITGNQSPYSYVPHPLLPYTDNMVFKERLWNTFNSIIDDIFYKTLHIPQQTKLYEQYFPNNKKPFIESLKSPAIILMNSHVTSSSPRPSLPNMIEIGGIHVDKAKELPKNLKDFLDSAEDGVIYFSMGSIIKGKDWAIEKREALVKTFAKLKQKVLWKYENETLPGNPGNIMIGSWFPQRDILAHPNIKVFITHGGLLGTTEALVEGVRVLGLPIFGDQKMNMARTVKRGYGLSIDYDDISEELLTEKLTALLRNPSYDINAKEVSRRFSDRPMTPQRTVSYWVEYVIRHNGADHLRAAGNSLNFFQFHLFDVFSILMIIFLLINLLIIRKIIRKLFKVQNEKSQKNPTKKKV